MLANLQLSPLKLKRCSWTQQRPCPQSNKSRISHKKKAGKFPCCSMSWVTFKIGFSPRCFLGLSSILPFPGGTDTLTHQPGYHLVTLCKWHLNNFLAQLHRKKRKFSFCPFSSPQVGKQSPCMKTSCFHPLRTLCVGTRPPSNNPQNGLILWFCILVSRRSAAMISARVAVAGSLFWLARKVYLGTVNCTKCSLTHLQRWVKIMYLGFFPPWFCLLFHAKC